MGVESVMYSCDAATKASSHRRQASGKLAPDKDEVTGT